MQKQTIIQLVKYGIVGVMNTLLTMGVIFVCKSVLDINPYVSNAIGYVVGLINSFIWNKQWVFKANGHVTRQAIAFICGFLLCYGLQLLVVWLLNKSSFGDIQVYLYVITLSGYGIATIIGNVVYTAANFVYNRLVTFK